MSSELQIAAVHESGHAVANWLCGSKLSKVTIGTDGGGETLSRHRIFKTLHVISWKALVMKKWLLCLLAGPASEMYFEGKLSKSLPDFLYEDINFAMRTMKSRGWQAPVSYTPADFFRDFGGQAKSLVVMRRPEIVKLADLLVEKREISGFECAKFLEKIWPEPLPTKALRYWEHKK